MISEIMLQQTRVTTVLPYYDRFLKLFPDFAALASAEADDVIAAWSGLGYYRRARHLHEAARRIVRDHGGRIPPTAADLAALPGFGEYTTAAVGSIALGLPLAVVDGNVRRVLSRLFLRAEVRPAEGRELAAALLSPARPGDWNQAMMELGAVVCLPRTPLCDQCPLEKHCGARTAGRVSEFPRPAARPGRIVVRETAVAVVAEGRALVLRRGADSSFARMWELPRLDDRTADEREREPRAVLRRFAAVDARKFVSCGETRSAFTHHDIRTELFLARLRTMCPVRVTTHVEYDWCTLGRLKSLPSGRAQKRLFALVVRHCEAEGKAT